MIKEAIVADGHGALIPQYIAVHSTANPGATAANHVSYWRNSPDYAVHLVSDWEEAYHTVPYDRICWQVGNGNAVCEGLEVCEATNQEDFERGLEVARSVILERLAAHGWTVDGNVRSHDWFTRIYGGSDHTDPLPYFNRWGWTWDMFITFLKEEDMTPADVWNYTYNNSPNCFNALHWAYNELSRTDNADGLGPDSGVNMFGRICAIDGYTGKAAEQLTRTDDPTGRGQQANMYDRVAWMAKKQEDMMERQEEIDGKLDRLLAILAEAEVVVEADEIAEATVGD